MAIGQQISIASGTFAIKEKETSIQGCHCINVTGVNFNQDAPVEEE